MKKLFVSVPMRGRSDEAIRKSIEKMTLIAQGVFAEEFMLCESYDPLAFDNLDMEDRQRAIFCLGRSIEKMAQADYFIGLGGCEEEYPGCAIENKVAKLYSLPRYLLPLWVIAPDV